MTQDVAGGEMADAIVDPKSVFSHPNEVVRMDTLSKADKLSILESWKQLEEEQARSTNPTSGGGEPGMLLAVEMAIKDLG